MSEPLSVLKNAIDKAFRKLGMCFNREENHHQIFPIRPSGTYWEEDRLAAFKHHFKNDIIGFTKNRFLSEASQQHVFETMENPSGGFGGGGDSTDNSSYDSSVVSDVNDEPATSDGVTNNVNKLGEKELADLNKHIQNSWELQNAFKLHSSSQQDRKSVV